MNSLFSFDINVLHEKAGSITYFKLTILTPYLYFNLPLEILVQKMH